MVGLSVPAPGHLGRGQLHPKGFTVNRPGSNHREDGDGGPIQYMRAATIYCIARAGIYP